LRKQIQRRGAEKDKNIGLKAKEEKRKTKEIYPVNPV
jgi:hypothetical protein